jgi:hypothetical protein
MISNIIIISLSTLCVAFAISYFLISKKLTLMAQEYATLYIDQIALEKFVESMNLDSMSDQEVHKENFIKFLSDSRDWAFEYIEDVQSGLIKFVDDIKPEIEYFKEYGDIVSMHPNYYSMKKITESYDDLIKLLPKDDTV